jgi:hypothetical protein
MRCKRQEGTLFLVVCDRVWIGGFEWDNFSSYFWVDMNLSLFLVVDQKLLADVGADDALV